MGTDHHADATAPTRSARLTATRNLPNAPMPDGFCAQRVKQGAELLGDPAAAGGGGWGDGEGGLVLVIGGRLL